MTRGGAGPAGAAAGTDEPGRGPEPELSSDAADREREGGTRGPEGTILIADDNEDCRLALSALLEALGYTVHEAHDGESAVSVAEREAPDLILMDIMMPGVDGLEATRRIRSNPGLEDVCIVAVTAMEGARDASLSAGCDDCIFKPVDLEGLDERVAGWMAEG